MSSPPLRPEDVRSQLERVLASELFRPGARASQLLQYLVETTLSGDPETLKEYTIGVDALSKGADFDPRVDSIVRVEIARLRTKLEQYYSTAGLHDPIHITLAKGSYVPSFEARQETAPAPSPARSKDRRLVWLTLGFVLGLGTMVLFSRVDPLPGDRVTAPIGPLDIQLIPDGQFANVVGPVLAISPDGQVVAFVAAAPGGSSQIWIRRFGDDIPRPIPGTEGGRAPVFSPDGGWIAFWADAKLKKVALAGGAPIVIADAPDLLGASWGEDGYLVAAIAGDGRLWHIPDSGGQPGLVIDLSNEFKRPLWPQVLNGSRRVIFSSVGRMPDSGSVEILDLDSGSRRTLVKRGSYGRYLPSGFLVYINQGALYAQRLNDVDMIAEGSPALVLPDLRYSPTFGFADLAISDDGVTVFRKGAGSGLFSVAELVRDKEPLYRSPQPGRYLSPRISPDGRTIALARAESGESRVWLLDREAGSMSPLTKRSGLESFPVWSPDGSGLIVSGDRSMDWVDVGPARTVRTLTRKSQVQVQVPWSFTPDGKMLAFYELHPKNHFDLWMVSIAKEPEGVRSGVPQPILQTREIETYPSISPDGKWLAYTAFRDNSYNVFVRPLAGDSADVQVSKPSGRLPVWSKNSKRLFYASESRYVMVADYQTTGRGFVARNPETWIPTQLADTGVLPNFDIAPDDTVIGLLPAPGERTSSNEVSVVFNLNQHIHRAAAKPN